MAYVEGTYAYQNRYWKEFHADFCELLRACIEQSGRFFIIRSSDDVHYVQYGSGSGGELVGEAVSNDYLTGDGRLSPAAIKRLHGLGWRKQGSAPLRNFSLHWAAPFELEEVADLGVKTLREAYRVSSPLHLVITIGSFESTEDSDFKDTARSDLPSPQLPSGLIVRNPLNGSSYRIKMLLGAGGFGSVYRVFQVAGRRLPGACVLKATQEPTAWHREAYFGDLLKHEPAVVRMYESFAWVPSGASQPLYCLISELMDGGNVQDYLANQPFRWKESKARREMIRILRAVKLLHQGGAVHRDLTPGNVFVTAGGRLKIGDFGIALHGIAQKGVAADVFNPGYAPPAVLAGEAKHWSPADDVFHVGKLFAMLLAGRAGLPPTRKEVKNLPCSAFTKAIIQRCIGEKRKRFRDAGELLAALENKAAKTRRAKVSSLKGKRVVFTGAMAITRAEARRLVERCGGTCQSGVGKTTDVLVLGGVPAPSWIAERKGVKLLDVDRERARGHHIAVLKEARFLNLVRG